MSGDPQPLPRVPLPDLTNLKGRLLVARPIVRDPNFFRTVVFVVDHNDEGAVGVVLNRPSGTRLGELLDTWAGYAAQPDLVFVGGPVGQNGAIAIGELETPTNEPAGWIPLGGNLGLADLEMKPDLLSPRPRRIRVFVGYAGWAPGQLEAEIEEDGWFVMDTELEDLFTPEPDELARRVLRRLSSLHAAVANLPPDPELN